MDRRTYLRSGAGVFSLAALAGCTALSDVASDADTPTPTREPTATPEPSPTVSWSEEPVDGTSYRVSVDLSLEGVDEALVVKGTPSSDPIAILDSSGEHTVAGPDTEHGPIDLGRFLFATYEVETSLDSPLTKTFGEYVVGSQKQVSFPVFLNGLSGSTDPDLAQSGTVERTYTQTARGRETSLTIQIPEVLTTYYSDRYRTRNYGAYVSDKYDDGYVGSVVDQFESYGEENGLSDVEIIGHMMSFVQNLEYSTDKVSEGFNEYPKYPTESLLDKGGDCEDTCILLASMLEQFGYGAVLLAFADAQHMALGVAGDEGLGGFHVEANGQTYYYVETTSPGWSVGEAPENVQGASPEILSIRSHPVLVFNFGIQAASEGGVRVNGAMRNVGDAPAETVRMRVQFQDSQKNTVAEATSGRQSIPVDGGTDVSFTASPPDDRRQRAKVSVLLNGELHDFTTSEYREPSVE